jgi:hypothetical protein
MTTFYVRSNGSGTHTSIQSAIYDAANGDTIDIGAGTWSGNIELYKSVVLKGAGQDQTFLQGQYAAVTVSGCSFYAGEDVITCASTASLIRGRTVTGVNITAGSRVSEIISGTQFRVSAATATTGIVSKTGCTYSSGVSTITLPSATAVVVGMKVTGTGVSATVSAYNSTTRVVTLSSPTTAAGSNTTLSFKPVRTAVTVTMASQFSGSTFAATIQVMNVATTGWQIKDMTVTGFDGITATEAAAIAISSPASGGVHSNWLIDNCKIIASGDQAIATSSNLSSNGGTVQNCSFEGKTFTGSEPADVPAFSSFSLSNCEVLTATTLRVSSTRGIVASSPISAASGIPSSTLVSSISGNVLTLNKSMTATVGSMLSCTFSNVQFSVPNVARQLIVIGNSSSVTACVNTTFKNNTIAGQTGAVISATGSKDMFNTAVSIDTVGGLIENNVLDGTFGAGTPNNLLSNFAIRSRGAGVIVRNNTNKVSGGRGNSGFYIPNGTSTDNVTQDKLLVQPTQTSGSVSMTFEMDKAQVAAVTKVAADPVFSDQANWYRVSFVYRKQGGTQRFVSSFRNFDAQKQTLLKTGMATGDVFELQKIIIAKSDRTMLVVKRDEISQASGYDFTVI